MPACLAVLFLSLAASSSIHVPSWLIALGLPGLFVVSLLDAAIIPLPLPGSGDVLILLLAARHGSHPVVIAIVAVVASILGGYTTWRAGKKGGETMLAHFVPKRMLRLVKRWMGSHGFAMVALSAIMPPPIPLMPLLLGSGALGATRNQFLLAFGLARGLRYGLVTWVGATYGPRVLHSWGDYLSRWGTTILWSFLGLLVAAMAFGFWQYRRQMRSWNNERSQQTDAAAAKA